MRKRKLPRRFTKESLCGTETSNDDVYRPLDFSRPLLTRQLREEFQPSNVSLYIVGTGCIKCTTYPEICEHENSYICGSL